MTQKVHYIYISFFFIAGIASTIMLAVYGFQYYNTPIEERFFTGFHSSLKPSGVIGHGLGILGTLMMLTGVSTYMVRKRVKSFFNLGYLKNWLEFHIFLCTLGPVFVLYHTAFKFGGIVSISFWSMVAVVLSGVAGRFIYLQIPRKISGQEISLQELKDNSLEIDNRLALVPLKKNMLDTLNSLTVTDKYKHVTFVTSFSTYLKDHILLSRFIKKLKSELKKTNLPKKEKQEIIKTAKLKILLSRRIGLLRTSQKAFRYWHIIHLPFAIIMFVIMIIHVAITVVFGYRWIF